MTPPKPRVRISRLTRDKAIQTIERMLADPTLVLGDDEDEVLRFCIRALKREQKAARDKRRSKR